MALQFLHFNLVSRVPPKKAQTKHWTVSETLKEAARHPGAAQRNPGPRRAEQVDAAAEAWGRTPGFRVLRYAKPRNDGSGLRLSAGDP